MFPDTPSPGIVRWCALAVALVTGFFALVGVIAAVKVEASGVAYYRPNAGVAYYRPNARLPATERVERKTDPKKFREAVMLNWYYVLYPGALAAASFWFYRRLSD